MRSARDFGRYVDQAIGSVEELKHFLWLTSGLGYSADQTERLLQMCNHTARMLHGLNRYLRKLATNNKQLKTNNQSGFTLIELLVVISIIAILAALILASLVSAQRSSRDAKRRSDIKQIAFGVINYGSAHADKYPIRETEVEASTVTELVTEGFITSFPPEPNPFDPYTYVTDAAGIQFSVCARLERNPDQMLRNTATGQSEVDEGVCTHAP